MRIGDVRARLNVHTDIVQRIAERHMRLFGHIMGMPSSSLPYISLHGHVDGKRNCGHPND